MNTATQITNDQGQLRREKEALKQVTQKGAGTIGTVTKRFKTALEIALEEAYAEAGVPQPEPPKPAPRFSGHTDKIMKWGLPNWGCVMVEIQGVTLDKPVEEVITSYAKINMPKGVRRDWLNFRVMAKPAEDVRILHAVEGKITGDFTGRDMPPFQVRVHWNSGVPTTLTGEGDNVDIIL